MIKTRTNQAASAADDDVRFSGRGGHIVATVEAKSEAPAPTPPSAKPPSKQQHLAALVLRDEGATLDQMVAATGWLPHTTRAALTGLKKKGYAITSDKLDGVRTYRAVAPE